MTSEIRLFTRESVAKAKGIVENPNEPADPERGGGFAEWVMLALHAPRIELRESYRQTLDLLSEMPGLLDELGLTRLPHFTALRNSFANISIQRWRAFLGRSAENAPAMLRSMQQASTATNLDATTLSEHTTVSARSKLRLSSTLGALRHPCSLHHHEEHGG